MNLPAYKAGHLEKIFAQEGICNPFLAPTLLAFIPVHRTGYSAGFHKITFFYPPEFFILNIKLSNNYITSIFSKFSVYSVAKFNFQHSLFVLSGFFVFFFTRDALVIASLPNRLRISARTFSTLFLRSELLSKSEVW